MLKKSLLKYSFLLGSVLTFHTGCSSFQSNSTYTVPFAINQDVNSFYKNKTKTISATVLSDKLVRSSKSMYRLDCLVDRNQLFSLLVIDGKQQNIASLDSLINPQTEISFDVSYDFSTYDSHFNISSSALNKYFTPMKNLT